MLKVSQVFANPLIFISDVIYLNLEILKNATFYAL